MKKKLIRWYRKFTQTKMPEFRNLDQYQIPSRFFSQYNGPIFLTPRYQKLPYSQQFLKYLRFMQRRNTVSYDDMKIFVQQLLSQYHLLMKNIRPNDNIVMEKNKIIPTTALCQYHGMVDWVYSANGFNMTPIMFFHGLINPSAGIAMAYSNMYIRQGLRKTFLEKFPNRDKKYSHQNSYQSNCKGYAILTTGHTWQVISVDKYFKLQKSVFLQGKNQHKSMHHDQEMIEVVLGMLDYCLDLPHENVKVLEKAYQYLDERKYMVEGNDDKQFEKRSLVSRKLLNYYKKRM